MSKKITHTRILRNHRDISNLSRKLSIQPRAINNLSRKLPRNHRAIVSLKKKKILRGGAKRAQQPETLDYMVGETMTGYEGQLEPDTPTPLGLSQIVKKDYKINKILGAEGKFGIIYETEDSRLIKTNRFKSKKDAMLLNEIITNYSTRRLLSKKGLFGRKKKNPKDDISELFNKTKDKNIKELEFHRKCSDSPYVVNLHPDFIWYLSGEKSGPHLPVLVMEACKYGSLKSVLQEQSQRRSENIVIYEGTEKTRREIALEIAKGMKYIIKKGIIHMDLKSDNIVVCNNEERHPVCKITDFGNSVYAGQEAVRQHEWVNDISYSVLHFTKQIIGDTEERNKAREYLDVWAFGCVMYEIFSNGRVPWGGEGVSKVIFTPIIKLIKTKVKEIEIKPTKLIQMLVTGIEKGTDELIFPSHRRENLSDDERFLIITKNVAQYIKDRNSQYKLILGVGEYARVIEFFKSTDKDLPFYKNLTNMCFYNIHQTVTFAEIIKVLKPSSIYEDARFDEQIERSGTFRPHRKKKGATAQEAAVRTRRGGVTLGQGTAAVNTAVPPPRPPPQAASTNKIEFFIPMKEESQDSILAKIDAEANATRKADELRTAVGDGGPDTGWESSLNLNLNHQTPPPQSQRQPTQPQSQRQPPPPQLQSPPQLPPPRGSQQQQQQQPVKREPQDVWVAHEPVKHEKYKKNVNGFF